PGPPREPCEIAFDAANQLATITLQSVDRRAHHRRNRRYPLGHASPPVRRELPVRDGDTAGAMRPQGRECAARTGGSGPRGEPRRAGWGQDTATSMRWVFAWLIAPASSRESTTVASPDACDLAIVHQVTSRVRATRARRVDRVRTDRARLARRGFGKSAR